MRPDLSGQKPVVLSAIMHPMVCGLLARLGILPKLRTRMSKCTPGCLWVACRGKVRESSRHHKKRTKSEHGGHLGPGPHGSRPGRYSSRIDANKGYECWVLCFLERGNVSKGCRKQKEKVEATSKQSKGASNQGSKGCFNKEAMKG